ncbi:glycosyltransferase family 2 protein [Campylobacter devanensis]|uniref:glycosyltransferase family 2 protein n=1 Tax=Campylobacter devanensis TaxID=3161138 RepID=UPI00112F9A01|nr:glycosyltransferase family 2 protein [Campylobacter sp. P0187]
MQEPQYDVSIIVPVHNREKLIIPCIKSINAQTYDRAKWEVIFVDDGSTDKSVEAIESLIDKNINYRIIKREIPSGNASAPRNEGIKASRAKYVFFLDSDDYIDEQLLENGCKIAFKNDSDIVYFKLKGINGRSVATRPFKKPYVEKADIYNEYLLRSLGPMKMFKVKILRDYNILFNPSIVAKEDQVFVVTAIINSHTVSILADKDYYGAIKHEGEHLSHSKINLSILGQIYMDVLWYLYCSDRDFDFKRKIYNALLIRVVETSRDLLNKRKLDKNVLSYFATIVSIFNIHKELFDLSQIYENEKTLTLCFLSGDFESFYKISRDSNLQEPLKSLYLDLEKEFKKYNGCQKVWVYNGKIIVIDFVFKDNKIAFDLEYDKTKKELKIWMFCRNNKSFFESSKFKPLEINQHKLCIFRGDIDKTKIIKTIAKHYEIIFTQGYNV